MIKKTKNKREEKLTPAQSFFLILLFVVGGFSIIMIDILTTNNAKDDTYFNINNTTNFENSESNLLKKCFSNKTSVCISIKEGDFL